MGPLAGLEVAYGTGIFQNTRGLWLSDPLIMVIAVYISTKNLKVGSHFLKTEIYVTQSYTFLIHSSRVLILIEFHEFEIK